MVREKKPVEREKGFQGNREEARGIEIHWTLVGRPPSFASSRETNYRPQVTLYRRRVTRSISFPPRWNS